MSGEFQETSLESFRRQVWRVSGDKSREFKETSPESFRRQVQRVSGDKSIEFQETSLESFRRQVWRVSGEKFGEFQETHENERPRTFDSLQQCGMPPVSLLRFYLARSCNLFYRSSTDILLVFWIMLDCKGRF